MLSLEGKQLGNYDVIRRIRVGGMGAVYEGRQRSAFGRRVAIKVILGDYASDQDMRRRFMREARTVARLHHPNILPLIEFGEERGILFLVMPFIDGGTLTSYLRRSLPDLVEVIALYQQILDAVEYAHDEDLIHRDIKSSNVLLEMRRGKVPHLYLADFGLVRPSKTIAGHGRRRAGASWPGDPSQAGKPIPLDQVPGTPHYMAPEQTRGIITPLTDIYALGVLLYQMLTGELPYDDPDDVRVIEMQLYNPIPSPCDRDASIPVELGEVVRKAMAKDPAQRFQSVAELREAFLKATSGPRVEIFTDIDEQPGEHIDQFLAPDLDQEELEPSVGLHSQATLPNTKRSPRPFPREAAARQELEREAARPAHQSTTLDTEIAQPQPIIMRESRARTTGDIRPSMARPQQQRVTEEPADFKVMRPGKIRRRRKQRRIALPLIIISMFLTALVLLLLIVPRVFGFNLFGGSSVATVYVTAESKTLQNTYVLTASPSVQNPDPTTHRLPARQLKDTVKGNSTVKTTGTQTSNPTQATGTLIFSNSGFLPLNLGIVTLTHDNLTIRTTQPVQIDAQHGNKPGTAVVPALVTTPGDAGNLGAHALDGNYNVPGVSVTNPSPFTGGSNGQTIHIIQQSDVDSVKTDLVPRLRQQLEQQFQKKLSSGEVLGIQPHYDVSITPEQPIGTTTDQVKIDVTITGNALAYNKDQATHIAAQLLTTEAQHSLGTNYTLHDQVSQVGTTSVKAGQNNALYLNIQVHGQWIYNFSQSQIASWPTNLKGSTSTTALAYLNQQPGVARVELRLPFNSDHLPTETDQIKIIIISTGQ